MIAQLAKLTLAAALLYWLAASGELSFQPLAGSLLNPAHLAVILVLLLNLAAQIQRWRVLLQAQKISIPIWTAVRLFCIGQFFFIPKSCNLIAV